MKPFIPRLIGWSISFVLAAVYVLKNYSLDILIAMAVLLGLLALVVFVRKEKTMRASAPAIAGGWIFFGLLMPAFHPNVKAIGFGLETLVNSFGGALDESSLGGCFVALIILYFIGRKKITRSPLLLILLRYGTLAGVLLGWSKALGSNDALTVPMVLILIMNLTYELRTRQVGARVDRTFSCLLEGGYILGVETIFGRAGSALLLELLGLETGNLYMVFGLAALGGLLLAEEYAHGRNPAHEESFPQLAGVVLVWSVVALIMLLWPACHNPFMLLVLPFVLYPFYCIFTEQMLARYSRKKELRLFFLIWSCIGVAALAMSRSVHTHNSLVIPALILLTIAAEVLWALLRRKSSVKQVMVAFLGVAAAVLLAVATGADPENMETMVKLSFVVVAVSVFWCMLCNTVYHLKQTASEINKNEFSLVIKVLPWLPIAMIALAVLKILLA